jgi:hypothetical protein
LNYHYINGVVVYVSLHKPASVTETGITRLIAGSKTINRKLRGHYTYVRQIDLTYSYWDTDTVGFSKFETPMNFQKHLSRYESNDTAKEWHLYYRGRWFERYLERVYILE